MEVSAVFLHWKELHDPLCFFTWSHRRGINSGAQIVVFDGDEASDFIIETALVSSAPSDERIEKVKWLTSETQTSHFSSTSIDLLISAWFRFNVLWGGGVGCGRVRNCIRHFIESLNVFGRQPIGIGLLYSCKTWNSFSIETTSPLNFQWSTSKWTISGSYLQVSTFSCTLT